MNVERLFEERTPAAAARQLAIVLAWATECQLATVEGLALRKSPPKGELRRHRDIAEKLVAQCIDLKVTPREFCGMTCPRLAEAMNNPSKTDER